MGSVVRIVTTPSRMVTVMGCGGGGGRGSGAAATTEVEGTAGGVGAAEDMVSIEVTGGASSSDIGGAGCCFFGADFRGAGAGSGGAGVDTATGTMDATLRESITCLTPLVFEAIDWAARRAASSGTAPLSVTMPSLVVTLTEVDSSSGSENQWRERRGKWREIEVECICFLVGRLDIYINLYAKMRVYIKLAVS